MNRFMRLVRGIPGQGAPASGEAAAVQDDHHDEQGTGSTHDEYKKVTRFFSVYFVVITLILLWNLFHCTTTSWVTRDAVSLSETVKSGTAESGTAKSGNDWSETGEPGTGEPETGESETDGAGTVQSETEKETIELLDGQSLILRTVDQDEEIVSSEAGGNAVLRGAALLGYENRNALRFTDESVQAEVIRAETGEVLGTADLLLRNQTPYPADEMMMYFTFSTPVAGTAGEELELRFSAEGLPRNGIFFTGLTEEDLSGQDSSGQDGLEQDSSGQDASGQSSSGDDSSGEGSSEQDASEQDASEQDLSGNAFSGREKVVRARLFYEKKIWSPFTSLLYFLAEAALAVFCLKLYRKKRFPFCADSRSFDRVIRENTRTGFCELMPLIVILIVFLFSMAFSYIHAVRKAVHSVSAEMLTSQLMQQYTTIPKLEEEEETVRIRPGQRVRQIIIPGQDQLSGLGIRIQNKEGMEEAVLNWSLYDETGTNLLRSGSGRIGRLKKISSILPKENMSEIFRTETERYLELPLDAPVPETTGRHFVFELSVPEESEDSVRVYARKMTNGSVLRSSGQDVSLENEDTEDARDGTDSLSGFEMDQEADSEINSEADSAIDSEILPLEICTMGIYRNNGFMKSLFVKLSFIMCLLLILLFFAAKKLRGRPELLYLACAVSMGLVFSFMTPPWTISDERTHVDTVYMVSNSLLGITDTPGPEKMYKRACDIDVSMNYTMPITTARYRAVESGLFAPASSVHFAGESSTSSGNGLELTACFAETSLANVSILCYLPSAVGFTIARLLGRNMITMFMAARWVNVLVCSLIISFAVKRIPYGGACLAAIALFPKTLQQIASCSYDGVVIAGTFLFIAYCIAAAYDRRFSIMDLLILFLSGFFVASSKGGTYVPLLGIALMIPFTAKNLHRENIERQSVWKGITAALLGSCAVLFFGKFVGLVFGMLTRQSGTAVYGAGVSERTLYSLSDLISSPGKLIDLFLNTVNVRGDGLISEMVGKNLCQRWYLVFAFLFLAFLG
ncbi:MAG: DUF2142 domain-containing protein, partial [Sarcina sp.]|nr:DUF2142 domain-containing protein [Sarcina sp.]